MLETTTDEVLGRVEDFRNNTKISLRSAGPLLGISHSTLRRWLEGTSRPYAWSASAVARRIEILDEYDNATGLYTQLEGMSHKRRVEALTTALSESIDG